MPGAAEYNLALEIAVQQTLTGQLTPQQALDGVAEQWKAITDRLGVDSQKEAYRLTIGAASEHRARRAQPASGSGRPQRRPLLGRLLAAKVWFLLPAVIWTCGFTLFPLCYALWLSLQQSRGMGRPLEFVGPQGLRRACSADDRVWGSLGFTLELRRRHGDGADRARARPGAPGQPRVPAARPGPHAAAAAAVRDAGRPRLSRPDHLCRQRPDQRHASSALFGGQHLLDVRRLVGAAGRRPCSTSGSGRRSAS